MPKTRTGASSIIYASRIICRMVGKYGTAGLAAATTPAFGAAVGALVVACQAWEALDDYPGQIDQTPAYGTEDLTPAQG